MDERLVAYVGAQWADLVDYAHDLSSGAGKRDDVEAQHLVLSALTTVAGRWWLLRDRDHPDAYVRRRVELACDGRGRQELPTEAFQVMEVGYVDAASSANSNEAVPMATANATRYTPSQALAVLERRARRVRRHRLVASGSALAAALVIGVVTLSGSGNVAPRRPPAHRVRFVPPIAFPQKLTDFANGVTAGDGVIWTIESRTTPAGARSFVVERNPVSGRVQGRYAVPESDDHIAFGFGKAWVWHDNTDFAATAIATVDSAGSVDSFRSRPAIALADGAFTRDAAWFTEPEVNAVVRFPHGVLGAPLRLRSNGARFVVPVSSRSVLVAGRTSTLRELPGDRVVDSSLGAPTLLSPTSPYGIWIGHGRRLTYQSSLHTGPTVTLTLPLTVAAVVGDPADGVYVATRSENPLDYDPYLVYYASSALLTSDPQPTARLDGLLQAEGMVADPAGGVVFVTNEGTVDAWNPSAQHR